MINQDVQIVLNKIEWRIQNSVEQAIISGYVVDGARVSAVNSVYRISTSYSPQSWSKEIGLTDTENYKLNGMSKMDSRNVSFSDGRKFRLTFNESGEVTKILAFSDISKLSDTDTGHSEYKKITLPFFTPIANRPLADDEIRIGYAIFKNNVNFIKQMRRTSLSETPAMRQVGTLKMGTGRSYETFNISFTANGPAEIASVQEILEQISLTPFLTVDGGPFGKPDERGDIPCKAIAVKNFAISTLDGFPNTIIVDIAFDPFNYEYYTPPYHDDKKNIHRWKMDDMICWPLFKLWCKTRNTSRYSPNSIFDGKMSFSFSSPGFANSIDTIINKADTKGSYIDLNTLTSLQSLLKNTDNGVTSPNVKKIDWTKDTKLGTKYYVLKIQDPALFSQFTGIATEDARGVKYTGSIKSPGIYIGLVQWSKFIGMTYADENGNFLPNSAHVTSSFISETFPTAIQRASIESDPDNIVEVNATDPRSLYEQIQTAVLREYNITNGTPPGSGDLGGTIDQPLGYTEWINVVKPKIDNMAKNPQDYFGIVFRTDGKDSTLLNDVTNAISKIDKRQGISHVDVAELLRESFINDIERSILFNISGADTVNDEIVVERISGGRGHNLAMFNNRYDPLPIHQYMGGISANFIIEGKCFGKEAKQKLEALKEEFDERAISKVLNKFSTIGKESTHAGDKGSPLMLINNEIFNLLGVDFVMPVALEFQSTDQQPNVWNFSFNLIDYDVALKKAERVQFLPTTFNSMNRVAEYGFNSDPNWNPILQKGLEWFSLQGALAEQEVYPDMQLPTKNELYFWVNTLRMIATEYKKNKWATVTGIEALTLKLTPEEQVIFEHCREFIERDYNLIATWDDAPSAYSQALPGARVDPDFYCYYGAKDSFQHAFHIVATDQFGKFNNVGEASGKTDKTDFYTEYSPEYGISSVEMPEYLAVNKNHIDPENTYNTRMFNADKNGDKLLVPNVKEVIKTNVTQPLDDRAVEGSWWVDLQSDAAKKSESIIIAKEADKELAKGPNANLQDPNSQSPKSNITTTRYFSYAWRSAFAKLSASAPISIPNTDRFLGIGREYAVANKEFSGLTTDGGTRKVEMSEIAKIDVSDIEKAVLSSFQSNENFNPIPDIDAGVAKRSSWVYYNAINNRWFQSGNGVDEDYKLFNRKGKEFNIDPHILRAVFLARDNYGQYRINKPNNTEAFGDFASNILIDDDTDKDVLQKGGQPAKELILDKFCERYKAYQSYFNNIPSIVLMATMMWFDPNCSTYRDENEIKSSIIEDIKNKIKDYDLSDKGANIIAEILNTYDRAGVYVDVFYSTYINLCRVYGAYVDFEAKDPYFFGLSPLVLFTDDYALEDKPKYFDTSFFPSKKRGKIYTDTAKAYPIYADAAAAGLNNDQDPKEALRILISQTKKLKSALDPSTEVAIGGALLDMQKYSPFGRLVGAFPSFSVLIINEGWYWNAGNKRLWDHFYTRTGIASIDVFKSRHQAASTCSVTFSNMFYYLTSYAQQEAMQQDLFVRKNERTGKEISDGALVNVVRHLFSEVIVKDVPQEVIKIWRENQLKQLVLTTGARLHVRMGYGCDASALPVVFNGQVVEAPVQEGYLTVTAVGDGAELEKQATTKLTQANGSYAYSDGAFGGAGKDPSSIVVESILGPNIVTNIFGGNFRDFSSGIAHFGEVYYGQNFLHHPAEMQINIYSSAPSKLEQGLPAFEMFNFVLGLTTYNNDRNLFSVDVHEPSPWKVIEVCRRATHEFVASPEPFCTRSTLFFGKWWYPYHYTYDESILSVPAENLKLDTNVKTPNSNDGPNGTPVSKGYIPFIPFSTLTGMPFSDANPPTNQEAIKALGSEIDTIAALLPRIYSNIENAQKGKEYLYVNLVRVTSNEIADYTNSIDAFGGGSLSRNARQLASLTTIFNLQLKHGQILKYDSRSKSLTLQGEVSYGGTNVLSNGAVTEATATTKVDGKELVLPDFDKIDFVRDVNELVTHLKYKPYMQMYIASSAINLLDVNIIADSSNMATDAIGLHSWSGFGTKEAAVKTITYSLDCDITQSDRKTMLVDTGINLTQTQAGWEGIANTLAKGISYLPVVGGLLAKEAQEYFSASPTTPAINNGVINALLDSVKEMYQGWFTMLGCASIKPRDLIEFSDHIYDLRGPVLVKEVIHRMDAQTGFITMVSPDAVVLPANSLVGKSHVISLSTFGTRLMHYMAMRIMWASTVGQIKGKLNRKAQFKKIGNTNQYDALLHKAKNTNIKDQYLVEYKKASKEALEKKLKVLTDKDKSKLKAEDRVKITKQIDELRQKSIEIDRATEIKAVADINTGIGISPTVKAANVEDQVLFDIIKADERLKIKVDEYKAQAKRGVFRTLFNSEAEALEAINKYEASEKSLFITLNQGGIVTANPYSADEIAEASKWIQTNLSNDGIKNIVGNAAKEAEMSRNIGIIRTSDIAVRDAKEGEFLISSGTNVRTALQILKDSGAELAMVNRIGNAQTPLQIVEESFSLLTFPLKAAGQVITTAEDAAVSESSVVGGIKKIYKWQEEVRAMAKEGEGIDKAAARARALEKVTTDLKKLATDSWEIGKDLYAGGRLVGYAGPQAIISFAIDATKLIIGNALIEGFNARLAARKVGIIYPLRAGRLPFTAGIRGHQGAVVGDTPSWADKLIHNYLDPSAGAGWIPFASATIASFLGVKPPEFVEHPADRAYMKSLEEDNETNAGIQRSH